MKFEQVFDNYKILIDTSHSFKIGVINIDSQVVWMYIENNILSWSRRFPLNTQQAFELANMYQEALALSQTKNLSPDLLVELGYKEVK